MKKTFLLMIAMIAILCSCSSSDNEDSNLLDGTTWSSTEEYNGIVYTEWLLSFKGASFTMKVSNDSNGDGKFDEYENISGSYTLKGNNLTIAASSLSMSGTVNNNTIHFPETEDTDEFTYYKK